MSKCIVKNCENHSTQVNGKYLQYPGDYHVHFVCNPCWEFILTAKPEYKTSTICRNAEQVNKSTDRIKLQLPMRTLGRRRVFQPEAKTGT